MKQIGRTVMKNRQILDDNWKFQDSSLNKRQRKNQEGHTRCE